MVSNKALYIIIIIISNQQFWIWYELILIKFYWENSTSVSSLVVGAHWIRTRSVYVTWGIGFLGWNLCPLANRCSDENKWLVEDLILWRRIWRFVRELICLWSFFHFVIPPFLQPRKFRWNKFLNYLPLSWNKF